MNESLTMKDLVTMERLDNDTRLDDDEEQHDNDADSGFCVTEKNMRVATCFRTQVGSTVPRKSACFHL